MLDKILQMTFKFDFDIYYKISLQINLTESKTSSVHCISSSNCCYEAICSC